MPRLRCLNVIENIKSEKMKAEGTNRTERASAIKEVKALGVL